nr:metal-dependent transcriptional regulator [Canibacter zhuwentaonis]
MIDTTEMYLRTILELQEEGIVPLRARILERLGHSGPTVSQTVARMERNGLVTVSNDRHLVFTAEGEQKALLVMRKHRLAERLLHDVIGLEWEFVHAEACRWEHVMSERVEKRIIQLIETPVRSPYGNPIPALDGLGVKTRGAFIMPVQSAVEVFATQDLLKYAAQVDRFAEPLQVHSEVLTEFRKAQIMPGATVEFELSSEGVRVSALKSEIVLLLAKDEAAHVFVLTDTIAE